MVATNEGCCVGCFGRWVNGFDGWMWWIERLVGFYGIMWYGGDGPKMLLGCWMVEKSGQWRIGVVETVNRLVLNSLVVTDDEPEAVITSAAVRSLCVKSSAGNLLTDHAWLIFAMECDRILSLTAAGFIKILMWIEILLRCISSLVAARWLLECRELAWLSL
ncbi:hypothetical protein Droror1_Dr00004976 [Drosera rotundifolia]